MAITRLLLSVFGSFSTTPKPDTVVTERAIVIVASLKSMSDPLQSAELTPTHTGEQQGHCCRFAANI